MVFVDSTYAGQPGEGELRRRVAAGELPRSLFYELAWRLGAEVIDAEYLAARATRLARAVTRWVGPSAGQLCEVLVGGGEVVVSWSDRLGILLALAFRVSRSRRRLFLNAMWLSPAKKALPLRLGAASRFGAVTFQSSVQAETAVRLLRVPAEQVHLLACPVDERFWMPVEGRSPSARVLAVGLEGRDYVTLLRAAAGLEAEVTLAVGALNLRCAGGSAGDPASTGFGQLRWTRARGPYRELEAHVRRHGLPDRVVVRRQVPAAELRELYARSCLVVVPLHDVDCDCGSSVITEAMAMAKPVVVTRTRGQVDILEHGVQGLYVPPGDPQSLGAAIQRLVADPGEAARMGRAGRALVEARHGMDHCVERVADLLAEWGQEANAVAGAGRER